MISKQIESLPQLAKVAIEEYITSGKVIYFDLIDLEDYKNQQAGVFVSLHINHNLRGCIGTISPTQKNIIVETIINAISAATRDPRFNSVNVNELNNIDYSVSLMMPPELIDSENQLNPLEYGLIVESGYKRGLLLPNLEGIDTIEKQLFHAKAKAGIRNDDKIQLYRFKSIEFKDK